MPIRLSQWHLAQAPQEFHDALVTLRNQKAHIKALSAYYSNIISDPFPSRTTVYTLYDQIIQSQKQFLAAEESLHDISERLQYFEDADRMVWITRPDRRRFMYEHEEDDKAYEERIVRILSEEMFSDTSSDTDRSFDRDSFTSSERQRVHFLPSEPITKSKRGIRRICTKAEVEADFLAANEVIEDSITFRSDVKNRRKRLCPEDDYNISDSPTKRRKNGHARCWPEAYFRAV